MSWWLFGCWILCQITLFSTWLKNNTLVTLSTGVVTLVTYLLSYFHKIHSYFPTKLINIQQLLLGTREIDSYFKAIIITTGLCISCLFMSLFLINKRQF